ncbi:MAG: hypothetical protein KKA79_05165 [Nanoarchaeota archaeon]|nr:hypothetical protein [Nanoarchaeota archaeon]
MKHPETLLKFDKKSFYVMVIVLCLVLGLFLFNYYVGIPSSAFVVKP